MNKRHTATILAGVYLMSGCAAQPIPPLESAKRETVEIDGHRRLERDVIPKHYDLQLSIDPTRENFTGKVSIQVELSQPAERIHLHAGNLTFTRVQIEISGEKIAAEAIKGTNGGIALKADRPLAAGSAVLHFEYEAPLSTAPEGIFRVEEGGKWYVSTFFQPLEAREAFPCFDQPEFKTPFALTLRVPGGVQALGNSSEAKRENRGEWDIVHFTETKPIPTYLVAFAIGPFDIVESEPGNASIPIRIVTARGKGSSTRYALELTPKMLHWLESYFGVSYPYSKLDLVAVPNTAGAMENVGLMAFAERCLVLEEKDASAKEKMSAMKIIAHELAHTWFGNAVTPRWWDDLWLNEAFATWMAHEVTHALDPSLEVDLEFTSTILGVMYLDAKENSRAIQLPIESGADVRKAFDWLTYNKGGAVIRMFADWIGDARFRKGLRDYINAHEHGTAVTADLLGELDRSSGKQVQTAMETFLKQPGTPLVDLRMECHGDKKNLYLKQKRYLPAGSKADSERTWSFPMCIRYFADGKKEKSCFLFDEPEKTVEISSSSCPEWIHPNAGERGYYRWRLPENDLLSLASRYREALTLAERIALADHLGALLDAENLSAEIYLKALTALAQGEHRLEVQSIISALEKIMRGAVDAQGAARFSEYARVLLGPHLRRIGLEARQGEDVQYALLRPRLIMALFELGDDPSLLSPAREHTARLLAEPDSADQTMIGAWLRIAAAIGDRPLWENLKHAASNEQNSGLRAKIVEALGAFRKPELLEASLNLLLDGTLRSADYWSIRKAYKSWPGGPQIVWRWLTKNIKEMSDLLGDFYAPYLPWLAASLCTEEYRVEVEQFFAGLGETTPGVESTVLLVTEYISQCARVRKTYTEPVRAYLDSARAR